MNERSEGWLNMRVHRSLPDSVGGPDGAGFPKAKINSREI